MKWQVKSRDGFLETKIAKNRKSLGRNKKRLYSPRRDVCGWRLLGIGEADLARYSLFNMISHKTFKCAAMAKKRRVGKRPGAGRPVSPEGRAVTVAVSIPEGLVHGLKALT